MWQKKTTTEQVAAHLRNEILKGRWTEYMPGRDKLAKELAVHSSTVERALEQLEKEGLLQSQGPGRRRKIVQTEAHAAAREVKMILYERGDASNSIIRELRRCLEGAGHLFSFAPKSLNELKQDPARVAKMVEMHPTALWIVLAGSRSVLEWFSEAKIPALALFGRTAGLSMPGAGHDSIVAMKEGLHGLFGLGHEKIVMLTRRERRIPQLGPQEQIFLEELKGQGFATGAYNLPDWEESAEGLARCLDGLFSVTPPTALFIQDAHVSGDLKVA
jgi:DNA-binding transcriptional regulator YhcF (GntR family)